MRASSGTWVMSLFDSGKRLATRRFEVYSTQAFVNFPLNVSTLESHNVRAALQDALQLEVTLPVQLSLTSMELVKLLPAVRIWLDAVRLNASGDLAYDPAVFGFYLPLSEADLVTLNPNARMHTLSYTLGITLPGGLADIFALYAALEFDVQMSWVDTDRRPVYIRLRERDSSDKLWEHLQLQLAEDPFSNVGPQDGATRGAHTETGSLFGSAVFDEHNMLKAIDQCRWTVTDLASAPPDWTGQFEHLATCSDCHVPNDTLTPLWQTSASMAGA
jgi:hypothetical protein